MAVDPLLPHESFAEAMVTGLKSCIGDQLGKHCQFSVCTHSAGLLQQIFPPSSSVSIIQELGSQVYSMCMKAFTSSALHIVLADSFLLSDVHRFEALVTRLWVEHHKGREATLG